MRIVAFEPHHLTEIDVQPKQRGFLKHDVAKVARDIEAWGSAAFTGVDDEGVIGSAGIVPLTVTEHGRVLSASLWALFSERVRRYPIRLVKTIRTVLEEFSDIRLEAQVDPDHPEAARLVEALGFVPQGLVHVDGMDAILYTRNG